MGKSKARSGGQRPPVGNVRKAARRPETPRRRKLVWLGTLGTAGVAVVVGVLVNVLSTQAQKVVAPPSGATTPQLQVDQVSLTSADTKVNASGSDLSFTPYKMDIKLLNTGSGVAVINDARLVIQEFVALPQCASQGFLNSTHTYSSNMPINPKPGRVVNVPLSQEVQSNGADRFDLLLRVPLPKHGNVGIVYLYRVHAYLEYNINTKPLDVGEVLVDLPMPPHAGEYYLDSEFTDPQIMEGAVAPDAIPAYKKCVINNSHTLHSILALPSMRPANLASILPKLRYKFN